MLFTNLSKQSQMITNEFVIHYEQVVGRVVDFINSFVEEEKMKTKWSWSVECFACVCRLQSPEYICLYHKTMVAI